MKFRQGQLVKCRDFGQNCFAYPVEPMKHYLAGHRDRINDYQEIQPDEIVLVIGSLYLAPRRRGNTNDSRQKWIEVLYGDCRLVVEETYFEEL